MIREDFNFERIIFQRQSDSSMIILLYSCSQDNLLEIDSVIKSLISLFVNYREFVDLFLHARHIENMDWRASQPMKY